METLEAKIKDLSTIYNNSLEYTVYHYVHVPLNPFPTNSNEQILRTLGNATRK